MYRILLLGAGKIGSAIAKFLTSTGEYELVVGDANEKALARIAKLGHVRTVKLDVADPVAVKSAMVDCQTVISACSFNVNPGIARAALESGLSYFDLTEDIATTEAVKTIAAQAKPGQVFMPQCGLAPGFVSVAAYHLAKQFDRLHEVRLRVGALPMFPTNEMKYNLTWSTDGLINEYGNKCQAVHEGQTIEVLPLEGLEHFSLDGVDYEAFNTSGGVGTLCETLAGKVRTLNYKTIRYSGHRDLIAFLMNELRMNERRALLKDIFENAVPVTPQDVVLIFCTVTGWKDGLLTQVTDARKVYHANVLGENWSAIQITTAAGICAAVDLHHTREHFGRGFVRQEQISLDEFLGNRFGRYYQQTGEELLRAPGANGKKDGKDGKAATEGDTVRPRARVSVVN
jgi:saccharopine dehydrogenase-like NADP-dependent oxidoreductase